MNFTEGLDVGEVWANGALVGRHGSWNREPVAGYDVVFVKFGANGKPERALSITFLDQFLGKDGETTRGRPADAQVAKEDRKSVGKGKDVAVRVDPGGRRITKQNNNQQKRN